MDGAIRANRKAQPALCKIVADHDRAGYPDQRSGQNIARIMRGYHHATSKA